MRYDVAIIGAGMSGLAAGIRFAHFDKKVCILEKHYAYGGLNSYYKIGRREFDVGLHAVTNFSPKGGRNTPMAKLLRQLRLTEADFDLQPQNFSEVRFPGRRLKFTNDIDVLREEVQREFPQEADRFDQLIESIRSYDDLRFDVAFRSGRAGLAEFIRDPALVEMLLCPLMMYGNPGEKDMDFTSLVTMFKSIFLEGFARPVGGVRTIIKALVRRYRECGGKIFMNKGVEKIEVESGRVAALKLSNGERITADAVLSSAGFAETMGLIQELPTREVRNSGNPSEEGRRVQRVPGRISFVETIGVLDVKPAEVGHEATIIFENVLAEFRYERPDEPVDFNSRIVCCPNNYAGHEVLGEGIFRMTWLANFDRWNNFSEGEYKAEKEKTYRKFVEQGSKFIPDFERHLVFSDMFTPRTISHYTGHIGGAVYGSPVKHRDGRTPYGNLFICGTDQGFLGIVGAMLSGITVANLRLQGSE